MPNRRDILAAGAAALATPAVARRIEPLELIVGGYGAPPHGGLRRVVYRPERDAWTIGAPIPGIADASFGLRDARFGVQYLLDENAGRLGVYRPGPDGWTRLADRPSGGTAPCHAALDARRSVLAIAHYGDGTVALHRLDPRTGLPIGAPILRSYRGQGANRDRQAGPHAHWVGFSPDGRWLHMVDFGTDRIRACAFDSATAALGASLVALHAAPGSGPRHLIHHPRLRRAYLVHELANTVAVLDTLPDGRFAAIGDHSTLAPDFAGTSFAAHIAIDRAGTRLYVSNRGANDLAIFALDRAGLPTLLRHVPVGGDWPRFFLPIERHRRLIVANQRSGDLTVFRLTAAGDVEPTGQRLAAPGAAYIGG